MNTHLISLAAAALAAAAAQEAPVLPEHPRPQLVRKDWANLNGTWGFAFDPDDRGLKDGWAAGPAGAFRQAIVVPFAWQSRRSGVERPDYRGAAWYRRTFDVPKAWRAGGRRVLLNIDRCDYLATAFVNAKEVGRHEGGYTAFSFDVTDALKPEGGNVLVVRVEDFERITQPTGLQGHYTSISGIWGTVWLEAAPPVRILHVAPDRVQVYTPQAGGAFELAAAGEALAGKPDGGWPIFKPTRAGRAGIRWQVPLSASWSDKSWCPAEPALVPLTVTLRPVDGASGDEVATYIAPGGRVRLDFTANPLRRFFHVGGKRLFIRGAGYSARWPATLGTPPSDEAIRRDLDLAKSFGLNALRLEQTVPTHRMLYWADKLGVAVMVDLPSCRAIETAPRQTTLESWGSGIDAVQPDWAYVPKWDDMFLQFIRQHRCAPSLWWVTAWPRPLPVGDAGYEANLLHWMHWRWHNLAGWGRFHAVSWRRNSGRCVQPSWWDVTLESRDYETARQDLKAQLGQDRYRVFEEEVVHRTDQRSECILVGAYGREKWWARDTETATAFIELTGLVRATDYLAGLFWCDLTDTEWEKYGLVAYDRAKKVFDFDRILAGWGWADFFGPTCLVMQGPLLQGLKAGERRVPAAWVVFDHDGEIAQPLKLHWRAVLHDGLGRTRNVLATTIDVRSQPRLSRFRRLTVPAPQIVAPANSGLLVVSVMEPASGAKSAAIFEVKGQDAVPEANQLALQFRPGDFTDARGDFVHDASRTGQEKAAFEGEGYVEYRFILPQTVRRADATAAALIFEAASCAGEGKVDARMPDYPWSRKRNLLQGEDYRVRGAKGLVVHEQPRLGYPQTDATTWPTKLTVTANGVPLGEALLEDDWAGAAGVLSTAVGIDAGSYGRLVKLDVPAEAWQQVLRKAEGGGLALRLAFARPEEAKQGGGLSLYGARMGAHPVAPTLLLTFGEATADLGRSMQLEPVLPRWNRENPYVTRWQVLGPAGKLAAAATRPSAEAGWHQREARVTWFRGWLGRRIKPVTHAMPLVELSVPGRPGPRDNEAVAVAYIHLPADRKVAVWTGSTDVWKLEIERADGKRLPPLGLFHEWQGVVPDARMGVFPLTKGWNELRVWTACRNGSDWQFSVAVTDEKGRTMRDIQFATRPPQ